MNRLKALLIGLISILALVVGVIFIMRNSQSVTVDFILFGSIELSAGAWVLSSFFLGLCVAWLIALPGFVLGRWLILRQRRKILTQRATLTPSVVESSQGK